MTKLSRSAYFYMYAVPTSFLAGYGFATSLWITAPSYRSSLRLNSKDDSC